MRQSRFVFIIMIRREYIFLDTTDSTSTQLKNEMRTARAPLYKVLCAQRQTAGRGRTGRSFFSPSGGIYFSATFPFEKKEPNLSFFTLLAGLYVCRTLEKTAPLSIKWPNDVMLNGKKVCGILTETVWQKETPAVVLGVGVNASLPAKDVPPALRAVMTSFSAEGYAPPPAEETVKEIVSALDREIYGNGALSGDFSPYLKEIEARGYLTGKRVSRVLFDGTAVSGVALGISSAGGLLVQTDAGGIEEVTWGEVLET